MSKAIRVLHLSTHNENCGIGKYQEMFLYTMKGNQEIHNEFFELSPNQIKVMPKVEYDNAFNMLKDKLKDFDILHIQHEYSFYWQNEMERAVEISGRLGKKTIVTVHTSANVGHKPARLTGLGPRSWAAYAKAIRLEKKFFKRFVEPLKKVDMIIVHNDVTKQSLTDRGIQGDVIRKIVIPVPEVTNTEKSTMIKENIKLKDRDVVYASVGFLHRFKGVEQAVRALKYLPDNYKLAIIGGLHPGTDDIEIYDRIADLIIELGVKDRVYITGYIADDDKMNAAIRECDICVYPYDREYYSNVSSAALNNALANSSAVVAYPTESFKELNVDKETLLLTQSFSYYELARELKNIDILKYKEYSKTFAETHSYAKVTLELEAFYRELSA